MLLKKNYEGKIIFNVYWIGINYRLLQKNITSVLFTEVIFITH